MANIKEQFKTLTYGERSAGMQYPVVEGEVFLIQQDLGQYGEYYGLRVQFNNGKSFELRMQEHEFDNAIKQAGLEG